MRCLILGVIWMAGGCAFVAENPKAELAGNAEAVAQALESFTGTWQIVTVQPEGATKDARRLVFKNDGIYAASDNEGKELWTGTFEIDPMATPRVWDHRSHDARVEGKDVLGIYELHGDQLKVACVVGQWKGREWVGKPRPKAITIKEADVIIELTREKSNKQSTK